ncbi:unnamed protein product [Amoebophrya sp. A25]|nr:unnamed protein product [Amoebophrya sp. A25]|eukprot:GSA25T00024325001.1
MVAAGKRLVNANCALLLLASHEQQTAGAVPVLPTNRVRHVGAGLAWSQWPMDGMDAPASGQMAATVDADGRINVLTQEEITELQTKTDDDLSGGYYGGRSSSKEGSELDGLDGITHPCLRERPADAATRDLWSRKFGCTWDDVAPTNNIKRGQEKRLHPFGGPDNNVTGGPDSASSDEGTRPQKYSRFSYAGAVKWESSQTWDEFYVNQQRRNNNVRRARIEAQNLFGIAKGKEGAETVNPAMPKNLQLPSVAKNVDNSDVDLFFSVSEEDWDAAQQQGVDRAVWDTEKGTSNKNQRPFLLNCVLFAAIMIVFAIIVLLLATVVPQLNVVLEFVMPQDDDIQLRQVSASRRSVGSSYPSTNTIRKPAVAHEIEFSAADLRSRMEIDESKISQFGFYSNFGRTLECGFGGLPASKDNGLSPSDDSTTCGDSPMDDSPLDDVYDAGLMGSNSI